MGVFRIDNHTQRDCCRRGCFASHGSQFCRRYERRHNDRPRKFGLAYLRPVLDLDDVAFWIGGIHERHPADSRYLSFNGFLLYVASYWNSDWGRRSSLHFEGV